MCVYIYIYIYIYIYVERNAVFRGKKIKVWCITFECRLFTFM
jgi:hypothetical protein